MSTCDGPDDKRPAKRLSLYGMSLDDALRKALSTPPPEPKESADDEQNDGGSEDEADR